MSLADERIPLTREQMDYVHANPGAVWNHPRTRELLVTVALPEISEPKAVTRARLVEGIKACAIRARFSRHNLLEWSQVEAFAERCWTRDLLIVEHGLTHRHMGVVLS